MRICVCRSYGNTFHEWSRHNAGCRKAQIFAAGEVVGSEYRREIRYLRLLETRDMLLVFRFPAADDLASQATHRRRADNGNCAPAERASAMRCSCRGRSSIATVISGISLPSAEATLRTFSVGVESMSMTDAASGPTAIFSM